MTELTSIRELRMEQRVFSMARRCEPYPNNRFCRMKDFSNAAFSPEAIEAMTAALAQAVATLPEPVASSHVALLAESILRSAKSGELDVGVLQRIALLELQITPRG